MSQRLSAPDGTRWQIESLTDGYRAYPEDRSEDQQAIGPQPTLQALVKAVWAEHGEEAVGYESWAEGHPESPDPNWPGGIGRPLPIQGERVDTDTQILATLRSHYSLPAMLQTLTVARNGLATIKEMEVKQSRYGNVFTLTMIDSNLKLLQQRFAEVVALVGGEE